MSVLMRTTLQLLLDDSRTLTQISTQSGIPYHWLKSFRYGAIPNPSVNRVEELYTFLTGSPLRVATNELA